VAYDRVKPMPIRNLHAIQKRHFNRLSKFSCNNSKFKRCALRGQRRQILLKKGSTETGGPFKKGSEVIENTEKHRFTNRLLGISENEIERGLVHNKETYSLHEGRTVSQLVESLR
jgi:hypothetical protein